MKDIENKDDVIVLVDHFYDKLLSDATMAPVFEASKPHLDMHLERVYNFWDNWLFQTGSYTGGMMFAHIEKNMSYPLHTPLFEQWLLLWNQAVNELFAGEKAEFVKKKALEIGEIMNAKLNQPNARWIDTSKI